VLYRTCSETIKGKAGVASSMRRLIVEISKQELERLGFRSEQTLEKFETVEVIHYLRNDNETTGVICKVIPKNPSINKKELSEGFDKVEILSCTKGGLIIYAELPSQARLFNESDSPKVYVSLPTELREGRIRFTLLGSEAEMVKLLRLAKMSRVEFKILSSTDAKFAPSSILSVLTDQQHEILAAAYRLGYFEVPRRITTEQLARRLGVVKSTLSEHLRKAQYRVLTKIMSEE